MKDNICKINNSQDVTIVVLSSPNVDMPWMCLTNGPTMMNIDCDNDTPDMLIQLSKMVKTALREKGKDNGK